MNEAWSTIVRRIVAGLGVQPGELIQARGDPGRYDILQEILLAVELAGATPLPEIIPADYLERLWRDAPQDYLANWDQQRRALIQQYDRVITLQGPAPDLNDAPESSVQAWRQAVQRLVTIQDERRLPFIVVALPSQRRAQQLGLSLAALEALLLPALGASAAELRAEIERVLAAIGQGKALTIRTGLGHELRLNQGDRVWLDDDGDIDAEDRARGAMVGNLPAGAIYTTVLESETEGSLWLPQAEPATDVTFYFEAGRIVKIEAAEGAAALSAWLDSYAGEPRRISHIGLGLNPYLKPAMGWTLVDEHLHGHLLIALGENQYMGGQNASDLNVDYAIPQATFLVDDRVIVMEGKLVV